MKKLDLTGQKFGRLTAISPAANRGKHTYWNCLCSCGAHVTVDTQSLRSGHTKSCGCLNRDIVRKRKTTHDLSNTRLFRIWASIIRRCTCKTDQAYKYYGGRGVCICNKWLPDFKAFYDWSISNGYKDNLTIDRINVNGHYCPENCRWISQTLQSKNRRCVSFFEGQTIPDYCKAHKISKWMVYARLKRGWPLEQALKTPTRSKT